MCYTKVVEMEKYSWSMQQPKQHGYLKLPVSLSSLALWMRFHFESTIR